MDPFIPPELPPKITFSTNLLRQLEKASMAIGNLKSFASVLPNPRLLVAPLLKKEVVASSKIEGTQATISDLVEFEVEQKITGKMPEDVIENHNYYLSVLIGIEKLKKLPISTRLICELHRVLLKNTSRHRGSNKDSGSIRKFQNYIGSQGASIEEATYVPPPPGNVPSLLSDLEKYINNESNEETLLIQAALLHAQFEMIHPFGDGNGRIGRVLITLFLVERKILPFPILYLSDFFERHRTEYYSKLLVISKENDWEGWISFFLQSIIEQSKAAEILSKKILELFEQFSETVRLNMNSIHTPKLLELIFINPVVNRKKVSEELNITFPTASSLLSRLVQEGILYTNPEEKRNKDYANTKLIELLL